jgi:hypothetical protein
MMAAEQTTQPVPANPNGARVPAVKGGFSGLAALEAALWIAVVLAGAGLRLVALAGRPLSILEGHAAFEAWSFAQGHVPADWPGSLAGATQALLIKLFGPSDAVARCSPALVGTALIASVWLLRPWLGRVAGLAGALLLALSPIMVNDARSASGDAWGALVFVLLTWQVLRFLRLPAPRTLILVCFLFCVGLGTDAVFVGLTALLALWLLVRHVWLEDREVHCAWAALRSHRDWLVSAAPLSLAALLLVVSRFGTVPERLRPAALDSFARVFAPQRPGLLVVLAGGGALLSLVAASRDPSTLVLAALPLALLGGLAMAHFGEWLLDVRIDAPDALIALSFGVALVFTVLAAYEVNTGANTHTFWPWLGVLVAIMCLGAAALRGYYEGMPAASLTLVMLLAVGLLFELFGAGSVAFAGGDEFLIGQRTTRQAVAMAALLEANNGGVAGVSTELLPPLAWYLRDTVLSGGHGQAQIIEASGQIPAGFVTADQPALISRGWSPSTFDASGMIRWWLSRAAWGSTDDLNARLVVRGQ